MDEHASRPVDRGDEPAPDPSNDAGLTAGAADPVTRDDDLIPAAAQSDLELFPTERRDSPPVTPDPPSSSASMLVFVPDDGSTPAPEEREPPAPAPHAMQEGLDRVRGEVVDRLAGALPLMRRVAAARPGGLHVSPDKLIVASGSVLFVVLLLLTQPASQDDPTTMPPDASADIDWEDPPAVRGAPLASSTHATIEHATQEADTIAAAPSEPRERDIAPVAAPPAPAQSARAQPARPQPSQPPPAQPPPVGRQPAAAFAASRAAPGPSEPAPVARTASTDTPSPPLDDSPPPQADTLAAPLARELPPPAHVLPVDTPEAAAAPREDAPAVAPLASATLSSPQLTREPDGRVRSAAVQRVLNRYRDAFNTLDPEATRAVWPSVDLSALGRAFDQIREQNFAYNNCRITVIGDRAEASCGGTLRYVPKLGANQTRVEAREWRFTLREAGDSWAIESVVIR